MKENQCTSYPLKFDDLTVDSDKPTSTTVCTCPPNTQAQVHTTQGLFNMA